MATATSSANAATRGLYVANDNASGTITQFGFNTGTGAVSALSPATVAAANSPRMIAVTPNGAFAYVTNSGDGTVSGYTVGSGGALTPTAQGSIAAGSTPVGAVVSPDGKRLYSAACTSNTVYAFDINQSTGALTANAVPTVAGPCPRKLVFSPDGKYLYASNTSGSTLLIYDVNVASGSLTTHSPASVGGVTNPVGLSMTPDGTSLYVANDGASTISQFTVNPATGGVTAKTPGTVATNGPARSVVVSPDGKHLYLATHGTDSVMVFNIASGTGLLSAASPASVPAGTAPRFVTMSPDGKRVFVTNNGSNTVSLFDVNSTTGALTASSTPTVAAGTSEWGMAIVPNQGPTASFTKTIAGYGTASTFNASGSTDPDGSVARYDWDWGDGTTTANGGPTPSHTYVGPGTYSVKLTVTDDEGCSTAYVATTAVATCNGSSAATTTQTAKVAGSGRYVYVAGTAGGVAYYTYRPSTTATVAGHLASTTTAATTRQVALSPDGKNAYVASTGGGGTVYQFGIDATTGELVAKSPATVAAGNGAHSSVVSPDGRHLYVTNQAANTVSQFDIDATTGTLAAKSPATRAAGSGPEIPSLAPNGKFLYVPNFAGNSVSVYTVDQSTGALSAPATMSTGASSGPTSVVLSKDSRFAYVVQAPQAKIATYSVNQATGALTAASPATITTGPNPHQAAINPAGNRLYVRSSSPNGLFIFDINASTGELTAHSPTHYGTGPNSLGIAMSPDGRSLFFQNGVLRPTIVGPTGDLTAASPASVATVTGAWSVTATPDQAPTASFTQSIAASGSASTFDASASSDPDGSVDRYDWDWGDGTTSTNAGATPSHTYTSGGSYTVTLTVTDNEGCSVINGYGQALSCNPTGTNPATRSAAVAITPPTITTPPSASSASVAFSGIAGQTFQCRVDGAAYAPCASPFAMTGLSEGSHTVDVRATDTSGGFSTGASSTWTVDTVAPSASITAGPPSPSNSASPSFTFGSADGTATFECKVDSSAWTACSSPRGLTNLTDGSHTFSVRATDPAGNTSAADSRIWTVDTTSPTTSITSGPAVLTNVQTASFDFTAGDPTATFACRLDAGSWTACTSPVSFTGLDDGSHTVAVRATDDAGNTGAQDTASWTVDTQAPGATIVGGPAALTANRTASFGLTSDDPGASFECALDSGAWATCTDPAALSTLADGAHVFRVHATDEAGNTGTPDTYSWTVDTAAPHTTILTGPASASNSGDGSITFAADEPGVTFECRIDSGAWSDCSSPDSFTGLPDGNHVFAVRGTDPTGNTGTSDTLAWSIDSTAPGAVITSAPVGTIATDSAVITFDANDSGATFECQLDGASWTPCSSPRTLSGLSDASHTFRVRATDGVGNTSPSDVASWTIDTTAPRASITAGPPTLTTSASATFSFTTDDPLASSECRLDAGSWQACTSPATRSALGDGAHTFAVRGVDAAGNVGSSDAQSWTVDSTPPATTIDTGPPALTNVNSASFAFSSSDPSASFECQVDAGAWSTCVSPRSSNDRPDGAHTFRVRAIDGAGNLGDAVLAHWTIDTSAPTATIDAAPTGYVRTRAAAFTFSSTDQGATFECRLDDEAWSDCGSPTSATGLVDGPHQFSVRPTDFAGNVGATANASWHVDATAPTAAITTVVPRNQVTERQLIAFESDDPSASFECRLDDGAWQGCSSPRSVVTGTEGQHTFAVRAQDLHGNVGAPDARSWSLTMAAPKTTIDEAPNGYTSDASPVLRFSSDQPSSTFECRIDDERWSACTSPMQPSLPDGIHAFSVRALSAAGTVDPDPPARSFAIDTVAPDTSARNVPTGATADNALLAEFSSNELAVRYRCSLDGRAPTDCGAELHASDLNPGDHRLVVAAIDRAGNSDSTPVDQRWTVDESTASPLVLSASSDPLRRRLRCATQAVPGAVVTGYQWLRDGAPIPGAEGATYVPAPRDDSGRLGCSIGLRFASGATRQITADPLIILGAARLDGLSLSPVTSARSGPPRGRDMTVRFSLNRPATVLVRLWCRPTTAATCPSESPHRKDYRRAVRSSYQLVGFGPVDRVLVKGHRGINRVSLRTLLSQDLPAADYRLSVRLHERVHAGAPKLSASLQRRFTVSR